MMSVIFKIYLQKWYWTYFVENEKAKILFWFLILTFLDIENEMRTNIYPNEFFTSRTKKQKGMKTKNIPFLVEQTRFFIPKRVLA